MVLNLKVLNCQLKNKWGLASSISINGRGIYQSGHIPAVLGKFRVKV
jgi:hypothetical protein